MSTIAAPAVKTSGGKFANRLYNFNAGPSVLPDEVIKQIQEDVWNYQGSGIGILEHSHRGKVYEQTLAEAEAAVRKIANVPANYKILFMTGGATSQSYIVPLNLLPRAGTADYLVTGYWAEKSFEDAKQTERGTVHLAATSKDQSHSYIPGDEQLSYSASPAYVHMTSNNTIYGTQYRRSATDAGLREPKTPAGVPLVCDASSDIYSRPIDVSKYGLIYAGAQKNLGTTGTTVVIVREDLIERGNKDIPRMLQYRTFAKEVSMPNTPPHFAIYTVGLVARWILSQGGLTAMAKHNEEKAKLIYDAIDSSKVYKGHARADARSLMNIVFRLPSEALEEQFLSEAKSHGLDGMKGHRAVGGVRVSAYNAMSRAGCEALAQFMKDFAKKHG
jgi:phosphoserine aminotransferase